MVIIATWHYLYNVEVMEVDEYAMEVMEVDDKYLMESTERHNESSSISLFLNLLFTYLF